MRALVLASHAYGGRGGIAAYNRDLVAALAAWPACTEVVVLARQRDEDPGPLPARVTLADGAARGRWAFVAALGRALAGGRFDLVVCSHLYLLPLARLASALAGAELVLMLFGIEAWTPTRRAFVDRLARRVRHAVSISAHTRRRYAAWTGLPEERIALLPNAIHLDVFTPGPAPAALAARHGLAGRRVLLTVGRMVGRERGKGFDEVLEALPALAAEFPDLVYLLVGDGPDRARLEAKAAALGMGSRVRFTGWIPEADKPDHYRLADVFVMPSRGEGFGFVFLEALACGVPAIGSSDDGSREALADGELGALVDPGDPAALRAAIAAALRSPRVSRRDALSRFSFEHFRAGLHRILAARFGGGRVARPEGRPDTVRT